MECILLMFLYVGIRVITCHGGEGMIDITVVALVSEHALEAVNPHRIFWQLPIHFTECRSRKIRPSLVQRGAWGLYLMDDIGVGFAGRLFEISNEAMHGSRMHR